MFKSIKTSKENKEKVQILTKLLNLGAENVIARIAIGYSLSFKEKLDLATISNSQGKEYSANVLFGEHINEYITLICVFYGISKLDKDLPKYIKLHLDDGINRLFKNYNETKNLDGFEFLSLIIEAGLKENH